jgi:hypothetical protein
MLENALSAMEKAAGALQRAKHAAPDSHEIILAATELSDAQTNIRQALRALPDIDASRSRASRWALSLRSPHERNQDVKTTAMSASFLPVMSASASRLSAGDNPKQSAKSDADTLWASGSVTITIASGWPSIVRSPRKGATVSV